MTIGNGRGKRAQGSRETRLGTVSRLIARKGPQPNLDREVKGCLAKETLPESPEKRYAGALEQ